MDELLGWRKEFPILESAVHMISHSLGAMPRRAAECIQEVTRGRAFDPLGFLFPLQVTRDEGPLAVVQPTRLRRRS